MFIRHSINLQYMVLSSIQIHLLKRVLFLPSHRDSAMLLCIAAIHLLPSWNPARFDACKITSHGCINVAIQTHHSTAMKLLDSAVFRISNFRLYTRDYKRYTCSNFGFAKSMKSYEIIWNLEWRCRSSKKKHTQTFRVPSPQFWGNVPETKFQFSRLKKRQLKEFSKHKSSRNFRILQLSCLFFFGKCLGLFPIQVPRPASRPVIYFG